MLACVAIARKPSATPLRVMQAITATYESTLNVVPFASFPSAEASAFPAKASVSIENSLALNYFVLSE